jgi:hypothetical protein
MEIWIKGEKLTLLSHYLLSYKERKETKPGNLKPCGIIITDCFPKLRCQQQSALEAMLTQRRNKGSLEGDNSMPSTIKGLGSLLRINTMQQALFTSTLKKTNNYGHFSQSRMCAF